MDRRLLVLIAFAVSLLWPENAIAQKTLSAEDVLKRVANKLASVKHLGYKYRFEYNYPSRDSRTIVDSQAFLDLQPADRKGGFKFQFIGEDRIAVYNGSERFIVDKKSKKLYVDSAPMFDRVGDISVQNSPLTLKYALPRIAGEKKIAKNLTSVNVNGRDFYILEFSLTKAAINADGSIFETRSDQNATYRVVVDKKTLLPHQVVQTNDKNDESLKTFFMQITERPVVPDPQSWYFSTYKNDYEVQRNEKLALIERGKIPTDFKLASFESASQISLDQYKGKVVLLEFWIAHCGFCIAAVPKLNALTRRFPGLQMISINMYDPPSTIEFFRTKNNPEYAILTGGDSIAKQYGVDAYPALVLIDKTGKVAYSSSGLDEKELETAISASLQE